MLPTTQSISKETKGHSTPTSPDTKQPYLFGTRRNGFSVVFAVLLALITHSLFYSNSHTNMLPSSAQLSSAQLSSAQLSSIVNLLFRFQFRRWRVLPKQLSTYNPRRDFAFVLHNKALQKRSSLSSVGERSMNTRAPIAAKVATMCPMPLLRNLTSAAPYMPVATLRDLILRLERLPIIRFFCRDSKSNRQIRR
jgi:hypothetical protein